MHTSVAPWTGSAGATSGVWHVHVLASVGASEGPRASADDPCGGCSLLPQSMLGPGLLKPWHDRGACSTPEAEAAAGSSGGVKIADLLLPSRDLRLLLARRGPWRGRTCLLSAQVLFPDLAPHSLPPLLHAACRGAKHLLTGRHYFCAMGIIFSPQLY